MSQLALAHPLILQIKRKEKEKKNNIQNKRKEKEKEKKKKKKRNNNLAVLPSHDTTSLSSFLIPRIFPITRSMGQPDCPSHRRLLLSTLISLISPPQFLLPLGLSSLSFFL